MYFQAAKIQKTILSSSHFPCVHFGKKCIFARENENRAKMKSNKTQEVIRQVAVDLFQKFGFEKTSMDEIARRAHKAKRSIYNHFSNKEALFSDAVKKELENIRSQLQQVVNDDAQLILPRLKQYLLLRVQLLANAKTLRVAMKSDMIRGDDYRFEELRDCFHSFSSWEYGLFKKVWMAKPTKDSVEVIEQQSVAFADMLQVTLNGLTHSFFVEEKYEQYKTSYEMLVNLIINSIFQTFQN